MSAPAAPLFSVIVATYNWSAALRCALASIAAQSLADFEVLVVGDGCSDDSAEAVSELQDSRFQWHNLPSNCGSQWGPNNHGLALARGRYVAYLGHDDLWWPTHLQDALALFERGDVDITAAATLMYGPEESGMRAVTGFFPNDRYSPLYFFPPSSMCHRLELAQQVGGWRSPAEALHVIDQDFLLRCHAAGARICATGEFTTFKFNAAWRRNAYALREAREQQAHLQRMRKEGEAFRRRELTRTLRAAVEDRLLPIELPRAGTLSAEEKTATNQRFKGSHLGQQVCPPASSQAQWEFPPEQAYEGFEWHDLEQHSRFGAYHWSGPSTRSVLRLPVQPDAPLKLSLRVIHRLTPQSLATARLWANGLELPSECAPQDDGSVLWSGLLDPAQLPPGQHDAIRLEIHLEQTYRPRDLGLGDDRRWLGLAIGSVWVEPLEPAADR